MFRWLIFFFYFTAGLKGKGEAANRGKGEVAGSGGGRWEGEGADQGGCWEKIRIGDRRQELATSWEESASVEEIAPEEVRAHVKWEKNWFKGGPTFLVTGNKILDNLMERLVFSLMFRKPINLILGMDFFSFSGWCSYILPPFRKSFWIFLVAKFNKENIVTFLTQYKNIVKTYSILHLRKKIQITPLDFGRKSV